MVDLLIFNNSVFKLQNVQMWIVTDLQRGLFDDCQEWHFQAANRSDKSSTILQLGRFLKLRNGVFGVRNFENGQCCPAMSLIC